MSGPTIVALSATAGATLGAVLYALITGAERDVCAWANVTGEGEA